jgi:hypothetical protein
LEERGDVTGGRDVEAARPGDPDDRPAARGRVRSLLMIASRSLRCSRLALCGTKGVHEQERSCYNPSQGDSPGREWGSRPGSWERSDG